ncbi:cystine-binding protein [Wigglesworthia glossinidia endosymbiont of Glossina morsitans morsitans (Yale colony)]|uniref:Cystine-binding protein n=1 Tax=Wigglesworthia glossinidia endosymbiont of Glossina morsitans morsitans (Yale colony) TaxID=1142511 RepID=H6Q5C2_WIGGL|nr:transporter substrate-binding domain-containing protein [Wigglesworthia glossinidia]AFA41407.1 cystine-binding protein [Wigglesworthia glossinidia endosymbiont of Glossina morsitans morsitans (Yale colony)]
MFTKFFLNLSRQITLLIILLIPLKIVFADKLNDIKKSGILKVAIFDSNPPFGKIDFKSHQIIGYDADIAQELAKMLKVQLQLISTNPSNRIPLLQSGKVDLIIADITITPERKKVINFSIPYFSTKQKILTHISSSDNLQDYAKERIGVVKGTTGQQTLSHRFPEAKIIAYNDIPMAFSALRNKNVKAITQDSTILEGLIFGAPDRNQYKILSNSISEETIGIGVKKGEERLLNEINKNLMKLENSGIKNNIYNKWFNLNKYKQ